MSPYSHLNLSVPQPHRLGNQHTERELVIEARPGLLYVDKVTGEPLDAPAAPNAVQRCEEERD